MSAKSAKSVNKIIMEEEDMVEEKYDEEEEDVEEKSTTSSVEEKSTTSSVDDELATLEREMKEKMERLKALKAKKAMDTHKTQIAEGLKERYNKKLNRINEQLAMLEKEKEDLEERIENLDGAEDNDLLELLASADYVDDADNELSHITTGAPRDMFAALSNIANPIEKSVATAIIEKQEGKKKDMEGKKKGTRTAIDRKAYPAMLMDKMVFNANGNYKGTKDKVSLYVIFNEGDKCFYRYDRKHMTKYPTLQDANREWCNARGYDKLGNAWEDFKALNLKTKKTRSIQNLHQDNWVETEGAEDFIDNRWNW